jgi:hypothetical protein
MTPTNIEGRKPSDPYFRGALKVISIIYEVIILVLIILQLIPNLGEETFIEHVSSLGNFLIYLLLLFWVPVLIPLVSKIKYKDLEISMEQISEVGKELSKLQNSVQEKEEKNFIIEGVDKFQITHIAKKRRKTWNDRYYRVKVWINSPEEFINKIKKVKFIRHPSFKNQEYITENRINNFQDKFSCWGEFLMRIEIHLVDGQLLKRTHYITFHN